jgi:hypothetical protein
MGFTVPSTTTLVADELITAFNVNSGATRLGVVNVESGVVEVPPLFTATTLQWYVAPSERLINVALTFTGAVPDPASCRVVFWP